MHIRAAVAADARGIAEVHVRSWQAAYRGQIPASVLAALSVDARAKWWEQTLGNPSNRVLVAAAAPRIVAFVNYGPLRDDDADRDSVAEVYAIYCLAEFWDRGIGRGLMESALASLRDLNYAAVKVWVLDTNRRAIAFYRKLGSAPTAPRRSSSGRTIGSASSATAATCAQDRSGVRRRVAAGRASRPRRSLAARSRRSATTPAPACRRCPVPGRA